MFNIWDISCYLVSSDRGFFSLDGPQYIHCNAPVHQHLWYLLHCVKLHSNLFIALDSMGIQRVCHGECIVNSSPTFTNSAMCYANALQRPDYIKPQCLILNWDTLAINAHCRQWILKYSRLDTLKEEQCIKRHMHLLANHTAVLISTHQTLDELHSMLRM